MNYPTHDPKPEPFEPPGLRDLIGRLRYKPRWLLLLETRYDDDGSGGLTFGVISDTEDSRNPGERIRVYHPFLVPPAAYNERTWLAWIFDRIRDVETHEAGEFLVLDDDRPFGPHHGDGENPYVVWHAGDQADTHVRAGETKP